MKTATIKKLIGAVLFLFFANTAEAQFFKKLKKKVEKAAEETVIKKTEEKTRKETGKAMDSIFEPNGERSGRNSKKGNDKVGNSQNNGPSAKGETQNTFEAYSKFDFVPGDDIIAVEDFSMDAIGDLPARWNTSNSAEVVSLNTEEGKWLKIGIGDGAFVPDFMNELPENFSLEFDLIIDYDTKMGGFKPVISFTMSDIPNPGYDMNDNTPGKNGASFLVYGGVGDKGHMEFYKYTPDNNLNVRTPKDFSNIQYGSWNRSKSMHISIWKQGKRVRVYLDEEKVFDLPRAFQASGLAKNFRVFSNIRKNETYYYLSNFRFAEGKEDIRSKLLNQGNLVTYGITFDKASAKLKPESNGVLKKVAQVLNEMPNLNLRIIGHTDSDGDADYNLELSTNRAESVRTALIQSFNVDPEQLAVEGKGETELLTMGNSPLDHAKNRRVEFQSIR